MEETFVVITEGRGLKWDEILQEYVSGVCSVWESGWEMCLGCIKRGQGGREREDKGV